MDLQQAYAQLQKISEAQTDNMAVLLRMADVAYMPLSFDSETLSGYLPITIGSILGIVIGEILIAARARRHHS